MSTTPATRGLTLLLVDDHAVFVQTLERALGMLDGIESVESARTFAEAEAVARRLRPDVALLDVDLGDSDGIALARTIAVASPATRIIMLTGHADASLFARAMSAGASGFLVKDSTLEDVADAVLRAGRGEVVVPERLMSTLLKATAPTAGLGCDLTPRELDVLALIAGGTDAKGVARSLGVTWHTARSYIQNVLVKLGAHSQLEAVATATRLGILGPEAR